MQWWASHLRCLPTSHPEAPDVLLTMPYAGLLGSACEVTVPGVLHLLATSIQPSRDRHERGEVTLGPQTT